MINKPHSSKLILKVLKFKGNCFDFVDLLADATESQTNKKNYPIHYLIL